MLREFCNTNGTLLQLLVAVCVAHNNSLSPIDSYPALKMNLPQPCGLRCPTAVRVRLRCIPKSKNTIFIHPCPSRSSVISSFCSLLYCSTRLPGSLLIRPEKFYYFATSVENAYAVHSVYSKNIDFYPPRKNRPLRRLCSKILPLAESGQRRDGGVERRNHLSWYMIVLRRIAEENRRASR